MTNDNIDNKYTMIFKAGGIISRLHPLLTQLHCGTRLKYLNQNKSITFHRNFFISSLMMNDNNDNKYTMIYKAGGVISVLFVKKIYCDENDKLF